MTFRPSYGQFGRMSDQQDYRKLEMDLVAMLAKGFPGLTVEVAHSKRWNRPCVTFRWKGFAGLLPEERFQRLVAVIPESFRADRLQGCVWLELAPGESVDEFLKCPRSEDIESRASDVYRGLERRGFFDALRKSLGKTPKRSCKGDFSHTRKVLSSQKVSDRAVQDARLLFIRHGAYCDCQVVAGVEPALKEQYAGAA